MVSGSQHDITAITITSIQDLVKEYHMLTIEHDRLFSGLTPEQKQDLVPNNLIFLGYRGSIAHGTYVPQEDPDSIDDKDLMGVFVGPLEHYIGLSRARKPDGERSDVHERFINEFDAVSYEIRKFINLLLKGNPNIFSVLWLPEKHVLFQNEAWRLILANKDAFISRQAYHAFIGYAHDQVKRMNHFHFGGYMGKKRKELVERFGYDTKNASHLIRLLRMGIEFLIEGRLYVERADAAQLIAIKRGEWTVDMVKAESDRLFALAEESYIRSPLPNQPDEQRAEQVLMNIVRMYL